MGNYSIVLIILAIMIGLSAVADRIKVPYPVLLVTGGIAIGFIPWLPKISIDPEIIFLIFLPPLLFEAAFNISFAEFKTNINTISTLAIPLVFLTTVGIAVVAHYMVPDMSWPLSFVLGAILSATDSVAATSITKGLNLPHKTITILEGESLVNDASALVAYSFAVAAVTGTAFVIWKAGIQFVILMGGGLVVGLVMAKILTFVLDRVKKNHLVTISFMLLQPFITYLVAEDLKVSSVIAVVTLGLTMARVKNEEVPIELRQQSKATWDIIIFLLNGLIFILIGLQLPFVVKSIRDDHMLILYVGYAFVITLTALVLRMARVFMQKVNLQRAFNKGHKKVTEDALLDHKSSVIISWSGMRGIVSLAIAIGLPLTLKDGSPFPERSAIIFISVIVVLFTLIGQGLFLPWIVKRLKL